MKNVYAAMAAGLVTVFMAGGIAAKASDGFVKPTPEELSMTAMPGYPGVSAVVLFYEEKSDNDNHMIQRYERIKILTEDGKKYANVELNYLRTKDAGGDSISNEMTVGDISARTIHPDGTVIPFTGKPYLKTLEEDKTAKRQAEVFTLPDVTVGSIIEYRYQVRYSEGISESPNWIIQGNLYVKSAHYVWYPTAHDSVDEKERRINSISWFPILPQGVQVKHVVLPPAGLQPARQTYELSINDVPPAIREDYMPPISSYGYRVYFTMTAFRTGEEFWREQGKSWSKHSNDFMKESSDLKAATQALIAGETTTEGKLRKIYAKVESLENTAYTRERGKVEQGKVENVTDVLKVGRGNSTQMTELFVAMARSAGIPAYLMLVPDRSENFYLPSWLSFEQFDAEIAIASVDGKDVFLDPGYRYMPYGHLAWQHTYIDGLRQTDKETTTVKTPGESYMVNRVTRVANLKMDEHGEISGKVEATFGGAAGVSWRHVALRGDEEGLKDELKKYLQERLPNTLEVEVSSVKNVADYELPFTVSFDVKGTMGSTAGKRLLMPVDPFVAQRAATFSQEKRETAVDFDYSSYTQDAFRLTFPQGFEVEALPKSETIPFEKRATYRLAVEQGPANFTTHRDYVLGDFLYTSAEYGGLRAFYSQMENRDKETVVLKMVPATTSTTPGN